MLKFFLKWEVFIAKAALTAGAIAAIAWLVLGPFAAGYLDGADTRSGSFLYFGLGGAAAVFLTGTALNICVSLFKSFFGSHDE